MAAILNSLFRQPRGYFVSTDPDPTNAGWHQDIERRRDRTHTQNLTGGRIVDLFAAAGLGAIRLEEEPFTLDFDEWFDRGTPSDTKEHVRTSLLAGTARGFAPSGQNLTEVVPKWSDADFVNTIRSGKDPTGHQLCEGMPYQEISAATTDDDLKAIYLYVKSLPPVNRTATIKCQ